MLLQQAPVIIQDLRELDGKLERLEDHFATISVLRTMTSAQPNENREAAVSTLLAFLFEVGIQEQRSQVVAEFEAMMRTCSSYEAILEKDGEFELAMVLRC